jgi:hypothetical protein
MLGLLGPPLLAAPLVLGSASALLRRLRPVVVGQLPLLHVLRCCVSPALLPSCCALAPPEPLPRC